MTRDAAEDRLVIAHRGASGYRPEHTLEAYGLAIEQGADFIEPDLVATADGVLICRHENEISATTDVAAHPGFADRRTTKRVDGAAIHGWFSEDFTLAEIRTLRARERIPAIRPGNTRFDGHFGIPTFAEVLHLARSESRHGRVVGVYPETKHPTYFALEGQRLDGQPIAISLSALLVAALVEAGFTDPARVFIQSFELANLIELRHVLMPAVGMAWPLVQLFDALATTAPYDIGFHARAGADLAALYPGLATALGGRLDGSTAYDALADATVLAWLKASHATVIAPAKADLLPRKHGGVHPILDQALALGLRVHAHTLRVDEAAITGVAPRWDVLEEAAQLYALGVHGLFFDQPDLGVAARQVHQRLRAEQRAGKPE